VIDLYAAPTSNGLRAKIMCDECGVDYKLHVVDMAKGAHKSPEFLKLNPMGAIPVIVDKDGPGGKTVTAAQSVGIMMYLAEKTGKFIPKDPAKRAQFWEPLMHASTDVGPTLASVFAIARSKDPHKPSQQLFEGKFRDQLKWWDDALATHKYCAGDEVTIADFALYAVVARARQVTPALTEGYRNLDRWLGEVGARPGVKKGMTFG
jgi:GST-like protein